MENTYKRLFEIPEYILENKPMEKVFNTKKDGKYVGVSSKQYVDDIDKASKALLALGVQKDDKVAIISTGNRYEWHVLDMALMQIGAISVPLYDTLSSIDLEKIMNHSDSRFLFASDTALSKRLEPILKKTKIEELFYLIDGDIPNSWSSFLAKGEQNNWDEELKARINDVTEDDVCSLLYTSGTTGDPKGVMITHKGFLACVHWAVRIIPIKANNVRVLSFLPISHCYERFMVYYYQAAAYEIYFAESLEKLVDNLSEVKPHITPIVPRLLGKIYDKVMAKGEDLKGAKQKIFLWAMHLAESYDYYNSGSWLKRQQFKSADKLVYKNIRQIFGGEIEFLLSGSAPLQGRLIRVFGAAGLPILEGYGMTELSPMISCNLVDNRGLKIGSVGKAVDFIDIKIAEDGEILVKGDNLFKGYYKDPEATAKDFEGEFFKTGDVGNIDENGFITITDRKKQLFKTSGGKYIAPSPIENLLKQSHFIEQIMVVGDNRKMLVALVDINQEFAEKWAEEHHQPIENLRENQLLLKAIQKDIDRMNSNFGRWEQVKKIAVTSDVWSIESGHMTPTLKIRRKPIEEKYSQIIENLYA